MKATAECQEVGSRVWIKPEEDQSPFAEIRSKRWLNGEGSGGLVRILRSGTGVNITIYQPLERAPFYSGYTVDDLYAVAKEVTRIFGG